MNAKVEDLALAAEGFLSEALDGFQWLFLARAREGTLVSIVGACALIKIL